MSSCYGENVKLTVFGQSHSTAIGMTLEGLPAGCRIDFERLTRFLERRAPGKNEYSTARKEADIPEFLCGVKDGITCGTPLTAIIRNNDVRSKDYSNLAVLPRPGHADYTAGIKYFGHQDYAGGGHFSGRLTAPICIAGGILIQQLEKEGISISARIHSIKDICDDGDIDTSVSDKAFPTVSDVKGKMMRDCIAAAKLKGDSVGGVIECAVFGLPVGLGDPIFGGMENRIASVVFGIPAVKGIEFGAGFESAELFGSENNDEFCVVNGKMATETNNCGGILGGITNGMPLIFRTALKPTPSISRSQKSVDINEMVQKELVINGRHDPCIVPRAVPCIEAAAAIAVYDALLSRKKEVNNI